MDPWQRLSGLLRENRLQHRKNSTTYFGITYRQSTGLELDLGKPQGRTWPERKVLQPPRQMLDQRPPEVRVTFSFIINRTAKK